MEEEEETTKLNVRLVKILIALFVITIVLIGSYLFLLNSSASNPLTDTLRRTLNINQDQVGIVTPTLPPTPRPIKALPSGRQSYTFSHASSVTGPKPSKAIIDPLTPGANETQNLELAVVSPGPVDEITAIVVTDNKEVPYKLEFVDGTTNNTTWTGNWKGSWSLNDSYDYDYAIKFMIKSATGNFEGGLTFRQSI